MKRITKFKWLRMQPVMGRNWKVDGYVMWILSRTQRYLSNAKERGNQRRTVNNGLALAENFHG